MERLRVADVIIIALLVIDFFAREKIKSFFGLELERYKGELKAKHEAAIKILSTIDVYYSSITTKNSNGETVKADKQKGHIAELRKAHNLITVYFNKETNKKFMEIISNVSSVDGGNLTLVEIQNLRNLIRNELLGKEDNLDDEIFLDNSFINKAIGFDSD